MKQLRSTIIQTGLDAMSLTGAHRLLRPMFGGVGLILMLHRICPATGADFQPNRHLEITPDFLRIALEHLRVQGIDIVTMDEACRRLCGRDFSRRFACFTFDDGYRDNRDYALPVMREFGAPLMVYVASDFAQGTGRLWWVALERVVAKVTAIEIKIGREQAHIDASTTQHKQAAFAQIHDWLRRLPTDHDVQDEVSALARRYGIDDSAIVRELCLSWDELKTFASDPLVTIGAHTVSHCNLAHESPEVANQQMRLSRERIEATLGRKVRHFAYPYGDKSAAAGREFAMATSLGFDTAVTTRPGMLFAEHADHLTALPRISLNGNYQTGRFLPVLTSGAATAMWNGFRRIDAA
ncbi:MAG: polysaccharide deacetylase family protein [Xanthobacteraceae bacterium]|nr:polysaccharide deacetylase family protein [Xanthobacteraceae bacterium]